MFPGLAPLAGQKRLLYINDFSSYSVGSPPSDWTEVFNTSDFSVSVETVSGSISGKALRWTKTSASRQGLKWDAIPAMADVEVLIRARSIEGSSGGDNHIGPFVRGSGSAGSETGYRAVIGNAFMNKVLSNDRYSGGSASNIYTSGSLSLGATNDWFWIRYNLIGSSHKVKAWDAAGSEPGSWNNTGTNSDVTAAGWTGLMQAADNPNVEIDYFAASVDGATIPLPS